MYHAYAATSTSADSQGVMDWTSITLARAEPYWLFTAIVFIIDYQKATRECANYKGMFPESSVSYFVSVSWTARPLSQLVTIQNEAEVPSRWQRKKAPRKGVVYNSCHTHSYQKVTLKTLLGHFVENFDFKQFCEFCGPLRFSKGYIYILLDLGCHSTMQMFSGRRIIDKLLVITCYFRSSQTPAIPIYLYETRLRSLVTEMIGYSRREELKVLSII